VINAFFVWLPLAAPSTEFDNESDLGGGVTAFIGATIFEFGSILLMLEAVNENRADCFGWAVQEAWDGSTSSLLLHTRHDNCQHHHSEKRSWLASSRKSGAAGGTRNDVADDDDDDRSEIAGEPGTTTAAANETKRRRWSWWPSWYELSTHYFRDIGFLACFFQWLGATVFWISGFTGLPAIFNALSTPAANGIFWLPQVIGGTGFIVSSFLFMVEVQEKWYLPAPTVLGWHIGLWNLVGAIGFTLCGALGFAIDQDSIEYASTLSTFVGSWAFLVSSSRPSQ
jgi:hypothetical protein